MGYMKHLAIQLHNEGLDDEDMENALAEYANKIERRQTITREERQADEAAAEADRRMQERGWRLANAITKTLE